MVDSPKPMIPAFRGNPIEFFKEVKAELVKVVWPTREEVIKLTLIVVVVSVAMGLYVGGLDFIFTKLTDLLIKR